jgi:hypothetical protein
LARHLEGWQVGAVAVGIAGCVAVVIVPRRAAPGPLPTVFLEPREVEQNARQDAALAEQAIRKRLDAKVRRLGGAVRDYGTAEHDHDLEGQRRAKRAIEQALLAIASRDEVRALRAYQVSGFLKGLRAWEATGEVDADLAELGGSFAELAVRNEWVVADGSRKRLLLGDAERRAIFKKRWNELVGVPAEGFALSRVEERALAGFLVARPAIPEVLSASRATMGAAALRDELRMKKIAELEKVEPSYPGLYARGVLFFRLASYAEAVDAFGRYAEATPTGPYRLRAINHMKASLEAGALLEDE